MNLGAAELWAIYRTVTRADAFATARDATGYAQLFAPNAVLVGNVTQAAGRRGIAEAVATVWDQEPGGTVHMTANIVIDEHGRDQAQVSSQLLLISPPVGVSGATLATATITQVLRHDGHWLINRREIQQRGI